MIISSLTTCRISRILNAYRPALEKGSTEYAATITLAMQEAAINAGNALTALYSHTCFDPPWTYSVFLNIDPNADTQTLIELNPEDPHVDITLAKLPRFIEALDFEEAMVMILYLASLAIAKGHYEFALSRFLIDPEDVPDAEEIFWDAALTTDDDMKFGAAVHRLGGDEAIERYFGFDD